MDAEHDLGRVERLGEKVRCPRFQRLVLGFHGEFGSEHQDRKVAPGRNARGQLAHDRKTIQVGHVQVQHQEIGLGLQIQREHLPGVRGLGHLRISGLLKHRLQQLKIVLFIIDDEQPGIFQPLFVHGPLHDL